MTILRFYDIIIVISLRSRVFMFSSWYKNPKQASAPGEDAKLTQESFYNYALKVTKDLGLDISLDENQELKQYLDSYKDLPEQIDNIKGKIDSNETLFKIIKPECWPDFLKQITDYNYRPKLRAPNNRAATHKLLLLENKIIEYKPQRPKNKEYHHTKKQSTTKLSKKLNTEVFGQGTNRPLVGLLFDENQCVVKALLKYDRGTYSRGWVGTAADVTSYQKQMDEHSIIFTDKDRFIDCVNKSKELNEVLAKLSQEAILGIFVASNTLDSKRIAIERQQQLFKKFGKKYDIYLYDNKACEIIKYTPYQQMLDFTVVATTKGTTVLTLKNVNMLEVIFLCAAMNNQEKLIKELVSKNKAIDVNVQDNMGNTALICAARNGHFAVVQALLAKGANVNVQTKYGGTALICAAKNGHVEVVHALLAKGSGVNKKNNYGNTALICAANNGHVEVVHALLAKGAKVNEKNNGGDTALILAANNGHVEVVEALLEKGVDLNVKNNYSDTALIWASYKGHVEVVEALLENGADVNAKNKYCNTALICAASNGHVELVRALLAKGADINAKDSYGNTALIWAAKNGNVAVVEALLEKPADVNAQNKYGHTALICAANNGHVEVVKALLANGADLNVKNNDGGTALTKAVKERDLTMIDALLKAGAEFNGKDKDFDAVLILAAKNRSKNEYRNIFKHQLKKLKIHLAIHEHDIGVKVFINYINEYIESNDLALPINAATNCKFKHRNITWVIIKIVTVHILLPMLIPCLLMSSYRDKFVKTYTELELDKFKKIIEDNSDDLGYQPKNG